MPRNTRIDTNSLRRLVARLGDTMLYTPGVVCPCRINRAQADTTCLICHGIGFFWDDTKKTVIKGVIFTPMMHRELVIEGQFESGDLMVSQDAGRGPLINVYDRIELTTTAGEGFEGEVRITSTINGTRYTILTYQPTEIQEVIGGSPRTGITHRYTVVEKEKYNDRPDALLSFDGYFERVQANGQRARWITWNTGHGPVDKEQVSVKYRARYEYVCIEQPQYRFQRDDDLGQLVHLRLKNSALKNVPDITVGPETPVTPTPSDPHIRFT